MGLGRAKVVLVGIAVLVGCQSATGPESSTVIPPPELPSPPQHPAVAPPPASDLVPSPPAVVVPVNPILIQIPGTEVYTIPKITATLYFFDGRWYYYYEGFWYTSRDYVGPWTHLPKAKVPSTVVRLPRAR
ncbi:MAG: hypothetical protein ACE5HK_01815 [Candidatus Methylomirabilales bacterium]